AKRREPVIKLMQGAPISPGVLLLANKGSQFAPGRGFRDTQPATEFLDRQITVLFNQLSQSLAARPDDMQGHLHNETLTVLCAKSISLARPPGHPIAPNVPASARPNQGARGR